MTVTPRHRRRSLHLAPSNRRYRSTAITVLLGALLSTAAALSPTEASAQLATRHYLPPVPAYSDSNIQLEISTPSESSVTFTIRSKTGELLDDGVSVASLGGTVIRGLPWSTEFQRSDDNKDSSGGLGHSTASAAAILDAHGLVIEATGPVNVTMSAMQNFNRSILSSKGDNALGEDFYVWSNANTTADRNVASNNDSAHFISIMATEDGTTVNLDGADVFENFDASVDAPFVLDAYQTITLITRQNDSLTGTHVTSSSPISVTSGDVHPYQQGQGERDGAADQLVPSRLAGTEYVLANLFDSKSYGTLDARETPVGVGNRYVQIVATNPNTTVEHYDTATGSTSQYVLDNAGDSIALHMNGLQGDAHYFRAVGATLEPFLLFLNSSGEVGDEMGGAAVPALRGENSDGQFCSGTTFAEFTVPADTQGTLVDIPTADLSQLQIDVGGGYVPYNDPSVSSKLTVTVIDPDGAGPISELSLLHYDDTLRSAGERMALSSNGRMHVSVGTARASRTGSFGYFSDFNYGFAIEDPTSFIATDAYPEPLTFVDPKPRAIRHCINVDSVCSESFVITDLSSNRGGSFSDVSEVSTGAHAAPCFEFTPVPVPGLGMQEYVVTATVSDETGISRDVNIFFSFTWSDLEGDGVPDGLDLDDDNDGIPDLVELGGLDLSGDSDLDGIPDWKDEDFNSCVADGGACLTTPARFDADGDGVPNHLDLDSDGDGIFDRIEGDDLNQDGISDHAPGALDANEDGIIDDIVDLDQNGLDDRYDALPAALQDSDSDGIRDFLDPDDDGDGLDTFYETSSDATPQNSDGDVLPDYLDPDDDGDGLDTRFESPDPNGDGNPEDAVDTSEPAPADYLDPATVGQLDTDGDGIPDELDTDDDGDGISDDDEGEGDLDGDGTPNHLDLDSDGDGIPDAEEGDEDDDGDGQPNYLDLDSDGDGIPDADEGDSDPAGDKESAGSGFASPETSSGSLADRGFSPTDVETANDSVDAEDELVLKGGGFGCSSSGASSAPGSSWFFFLLVAMGFQLVGRVKQTIKGGRESLSDHS